MDTWCPVSTYIPAERVKDPHDLKLWYKVSGLGFSTRRLGWPVADSCCAQVNGEFRQNGSTSLMLYRIPELIAHCSSIMRLEAGDLILTGTPEGVSQVVPGDKVTAALEQGDETLATLSHTMTARQGGYQFKSDK